MHATRPRIARPGHLAGFSLIELMISVLLGMILIGSVLALVITVMGSNTETIRNTRLTQELRTLVEVMGREAERARLIADPFNNIGNPPVAGNPNVGATNPNALIDDDTDGCLRFSYAEPDGSAGTNNTAVTFVLRNGAVFAGRTADAPLENWTDPDGLVRRRTTLVTCANATNRLTSPELTITDLNMTVLDDADVDANDWVDCDQPDSILLVEVVGHLANDNTVTRTVTDRIRVGSSDLKVNPACYL